MTAALVIGGVLFVACIVVGAAADAYAHWMPRWRLRVVFRAQRRDRRAANVVRLPIAVEPVFELCDRGAA